MTRHRFLRIATGIACLSLYLAAGLAQADAISDCDSAEAGRVVAGCTALIEGGNLEGSALATAYARRSDAHAERGALDTALEDREQALRIDSSDDALRDWLVGAYTLRGSLHIENDKSDSAITDFEAAYRLAPGIKIVGDTLAKLYEVKGMEALKNGTHRDAIAAFSRAIKLTGTSARIFFNRALAHAAAGERNRAIDDFSAALRENPEYLEAYRGRAGFFLESGDVKKAVADLETVLGRSPNNTDALLLRAMAYEAAGEREKAKTDFKATLVLDSENRDAMSGLARLGKATEALAQLLQIELNRVGCYPGPIDGKWGRKSKLALKSFEQNSEENFDTSEPQQETLNAIASHGDNVCQRQQEQAAPTDSNAEYTIEVRVKPPNDPNLECCIEAQIYFCKKGWEQKACGREREDCKQYIAATNDQAFCSIIDGVRNGTFVPDRANQ